MEAKKVFISYSHDSEAHRKRILELSDQLRDDGIDCYIDQYMNSSPAEGWQRWMEQQIEYADFVFVVCTELYLKRFKGEDFEGGRGVNFEGTIISQVLYDNYQRNTKFIPLIPDDGDMDNVPLILKRGSTYKFDSDYESLYRVITDQPRAAAKPLGEKKHFPTLNDDDSMPGSSRIHTDHLPTVEGELFGRKEELSLLDKAWANPQTHIVEFIASGGTGKTKLLKHWLDNNSERIEALIAWSFYSQGSSEDKQVSATPFFAHAFSVLNSDKTTFATEEEKGEHLAALLEQRQCMLVLDGLEPLQHAGRGMRGEIKDRAMAQLLKSLAHYSNSLCIITTRIAVHELSDRPAHVISHDLRNLAPKDGVDLLKSLEVKGTDAELKNAVKEYGCHALALHLLGNALSSYLDGDVRKRDTLEELIGEYDAVERHAFKVMQAYQHWFKDTAELQLLFLLGLFDHPVETEVLELLWQEQISNLTEGIPPKAWKVAIRDLRDKHRLLSTHENRPDLLDCHPLIREYFGRQLQTQHPDAWRQAHTKLYEYYKALPEKELLDSVEEMQPLFRAVAHGCAAGLHQLALDEVYWTRIQRAGENYLCNKLGAFSDDLAVVAHFLTTPWRLPAAGLTEADKAWLLSIIGFRLRALGRLREAVEPMQSSVDVRVKQENWKAAAANAINLSELQLTLGDFALAVERAKQSEAYADKSEDRFMRIVCRTAYADALHQSGQTAEALRQFQAAEALQQEYQPGTPYLYSLRGFRYCDLLLSLGGEDDAQIAAVVERYEQWVKWRQKSDSLLDRSLEYLIAGRAHLQQGNLPQAADRLEQAVAGLRKYRSHQHLPRGLLARAALFRHTGDFSLAHRDLQEVFVLAEPSEMRLHLSDYYLEMARLLLAENKPRAEIESHIDQAATLIEETGYHRRDKELEALKQSL